VSSGGISLQYECDRQLVGIERIPKIGKRDRQELDSADELMEREPRPTPCQLE
jgi:hypothetical protein